MLYQLIIGPLALVFDMIYAIALRITTNPGLAIVFLSLTMNLLVLPLYRKADAMQEEEKRTLQSLTPGMNHIKKAFKGDERYMMLQTYYRQNNYKPYYALKGSISLLLEIPFFIGAYRFLSNLQLLQGVPFGPIADLGAPDALVNLSGVTINVLPILMTGINIISSAIYTKEMPLKSKVQLYGVAFVFLVFLYDSPSGLVFYWTLNNLFSLGKNILYKVPNPQKILRTGAFVLGLILMAYTLVFHPMPTLKRRAACMLLSMSMMLPLVLDLRPKPSKTQAVKNDDNNGNKEYDKLFLCGCIILTVLTGLLIPSAVIRASPAEFVQEYAFRSPLWYIVNSFLLAAGTFLLWMNVFYRLSEKWTRKNISIVVLCFSLIATVNYMFFGNGYGNMSAQLQYDENVSVSLRSVLLNGGGMVVLAGCFVFLIRWKNKLMRLTSIAICVSVFGMSVMNMTAIASNTRELEAIYQQDVMEQKAVLPLDRSGKNVVVIMMDRAINSFIPYLFKEKPELQKQFAGFVYYPNTISFGSHTNVGVPGVYGGYEYIPEAMNRRSDVLLADKHNEALKVMPIVFRNAGYKVTVCDAPYAGYGWTPDMSIFDEYPEISKFITKGTFNEREERKEKRIEDIRNRNFFCYSIFRISPLVLHETLYNNGLYNESDAAIKKGADDIPLIDQLADSPSTAYGSVDYFKKPYLVLTRLENLTTITDDQTNTFLVIANDTAHDVQLLQEPEYEPREVVDNRSYDELHKVRDSISGEQLHLEKTIQFEHYQANMAAMIQLGKWMDYLRENDVYDNTRIIIVSDHGRNLGLFDQRFEEDSGALGDAMLYQALLMVKDFDSHEFSTDLSFMTNADTPALAFSGIIEDPVNPFTGKEINMSGKETDEKHIAFAVDYSPETNNGYQFKDLIWIGFKGNDVGNKDAWFTIGQTLGKH